MNLTNPNARTRWVFLSQGGTMTELSPYIVRETDPDDEPDNDDSGDESEDADEE